LAYISAAESIRVSSTTFTQSAQKDICDFLLVINSNLPRMLHRFRDIASQRSKIATFFYHSLV